MKQEAQIACIHAYIECLIKF